MGRMVITFAGNRNPGTDLVPGFCIALEIPVHTSNIPVCAACPAGNSGAVDGLLSGALLQAAMTVEWGSRMEVT